MRRWLVLTVTIAFANGAWAQAPSRAEKLGQDLFDAQEYAAARGQFVRAYEESPAPALLFQIALTYQGEGLFRQAKLYFERYAAETPASDPNHGEAERLAQLMGRAAERGDPGPSAGRSDRLLPLFEDTALDLDDADEEEGLFEEDDELTAKQRTARVLFWTSSAVAAAAATTLIVSAYNVDHYEDELNGAIVDSMADPNPQNRIEGEGDACEVVETLSGPHAERAQDACDHGKSWARTANIMTVGLLATGITSMYFLYVGYLQHDGGDAADDDDDDDEDDDEHPAVPRKGRDGLIMPTVTPTQIGLHFETRF